MVETLEKIEKIVDRWSETELTGYYYDGIVGSATIECNPTKGQIWNVLSELKFLNELNLIGNIKKIELELAENKDHDKDILHIEYTEIYKAEEHVEYWKECLRIKNKVIKDLKNEIKELKANKEMV